MPNFLSPEISVVEVRRSIVVAKQISPNTLAMLGSAAQGPVNRPLLCTSLEEATAIYGLDDGGPLYQSLVGFFKNGGERVVINRCAHYGDITDLGTLTCEAASLELLTAGEDATAAVKTSSTGPWDFSVANGVAQPAVLSAPIGGNPADDMEIARTPSVLTAAGNFVGAATVATTALFRINGVEVVYTTPDPAPTTKEALALDLAAQIPGVFGGLATNKVTLTTDEMGSAADIDYLSSTGDFGVQSGFGAGPTAGVNAGPNDVAKISDVHASELGPLIQAAWVSGGGVTALVVGETMTISTVGLGATASIGTVTGTGMDMVNNPLVFTEVGLVTGTDAGEPSILTFTATATSEGEHGNGLAITTKRVDAVVCKITEDMLVADAPFDSMKVDNVARLRKGHQVYGEDTSTTGIFRGVVKRIVGKQVFFENPVTPTQDIEAANLPTITKETFNLSVIVDGAVSKSKNYVDLSMSILDTKYFVYAIGGDPKLMDPLLRVYVTDAEVAYSNTIDPRPSDVTLAPLTGGIDSDPLVNADVIGSLSTATGLYSLDSNNDFSITCIPGFENAEVQKALEEYAESKKSHVTLLDAPPNLTPAALVTYKNVTAGIFSTYAIMHAGRIRVTRESNGQIEDFPNVGYVAGMFARNDRDYNVSEPPAGNKKGRLFGVVDIANNNEYDDKNKRDIVYPEGINVIFSSNVGAIYFGQTLTDNLGEINVIGIRRAFIYLGKVINQLSQFVLFEKNTPILRANYVSTVSGYLREQWRKGVLDGATVDEAYVVECDSKNNPPSLIAAQGFYAKIQLHILPGISYGQVEMSKLSNSLLNE